MTTNAWVGERCGKFDSDKCDECRRKDFKELTKYRQEQALRDRRYARVVRWDVYHWQRVLGDRPRLTYVDTRLFQYEAEKMAEEVMGRGCYEVVKSIVDPCRPMKRTISHEPPTEGWARKQILDAWKEAVAA